MPLATELNVNTSATAMDMADAMFGNGVTITSATYTGAAGASGTYTGADATLGSLTQSDTGVILSTGNAVDFTNSSGTTDTNTAAGTSTDHSGVGEVNGDTALDAVSGQATQDGAFFDATFVATGDLLTMQFVFTSEEYLEYVNGGVNDAMGVWVNGTYVPLTLADGSNQNVTIDTINNNVTSNLYVDNAATDDTYNTEMDGGTVVLSLTAPVTAGGSNTIRIGIGDGGDSAYDSNLLIMGDSIQTISIAQSDEFAQGPNTTQVHDLLSNDININGNALTITHINNVAVSAGGTVTLPSGEQVTLNADGTVSVLTDADIGTNSFTYSTIDTAGNVSTGLASIETTNSPPDFIVEGTGGADVIDVTYTGDPEGDMIDSTDHSDASNDDSVEGYGGADIITSGLGNDTVDAGAGQDTVDGGVGDDSILGGTGADSLIGGIGNDTILGGDGSDTVLGGTGNDMLFGGDGTDSLEGGAGDDTITLTDGTGDVAIGGEDNDRIVVEAGAYSGGETVTVDGSTTGTDDDTLDLSSWTSYSNLTQTTDADGDSRSGSVTLTDASGNSIIVNFAEIENLILPDLLPLNYIVEGTAGADTIDVAYSGDPQGDLIDNSDHSDGSDDDSVQAGAGDDVVLSGVGDDSIDGGSGSDSLYGGTGNDSVLGDTGNDSISGEAGDDTIRGGMGNDTILGGAGNDSIYGNEGDDSITGGVGADTIFGETGNDSISGGVGDDHIEGNEGDDTLSGGAGNDFVRGSFGNDSITSDAGNDYLWGGYGDDTFAYTDGFGDDTIEGEEANETNGDTIDLSGVTANLTVDLTSANPEAGTFTDGTDTVNFVEIENIILGGGDDTLVLGTGGGHDTVQGFTIPTDVGGGTYVGNDVLDISSLLDTNGAPVNTDDVTLSTDVNGDAVLTFPSGESLTLVGVTEASITDPDVLEAMGIPQPNYIVEGTAAGELIDGTYITDPNGDVIDGNDNQTNTNADSVQAGAGDDTVLSYAGNDTIDGGTGNDSLDGGDGDDQILGGVGNDTMQGWFGDDSLSGGAGDDSLMGWTGDDTLVGGTGDDRIEGGDDQDVIILENSFGNDNIDGGDGGATDYDTLDMSAVTTNTTVDLSGAIAESGTVTSAGDTATFVDIENIVLGSGTDTVVLADGSGSDTVASFEAPTDTGGGTFTGNDQLDVSGMTDAGGNPVNVHDVTVTDTNGDGTGDAILTFPNGESITLVGVAPTDVDSYNALVALGIPGTDEIVSGTAGGDNITTGYVGDPDGDLVDSTDNSGANNDDVIEAGAGDDTVNSQAGNDSVDGGAGNDSLFGNAGEDTLSGGTGDDTLYGGVGADTLSGDAGNDSIGLDQGDVGTGGDGDDYFDVSLNGTDAPSTISVTGGEGGETTGDTLDFNGLIGFGDVIYTNTDPGVGGGMSGSATLSDGTVVTFDEIENVIICFTEGTRIATPKGARDVADLAIGDMIVTRDNGLQPIRWVGKRTVPAMGRLAPIRFAPNTVGNERELLVSPQHRMLIQGADASLLFGESEVLASAKHLVNGGSVVEQHGGEVTYVHIMFDQHEIVYAEGAASESFYPGGTGLDAVEAQARDELFTLFPELRSHENSYGDTARLCLKAHESRLLRLT